MPTGVNWTAFSIRFEEAIEAKGFWGHFDGNTPCPVRAKGKSRATTVQCRAVPCN